MNIIDREEFLQRLDLRIRTMSELMLTHEKYIISLSLNDKKRDEAIRDIEKANKKFLKAVSSIDNKMIEYYAKLRQENDITEAHNA